MSEALQTYLKSEFLGKQALDVFSFLDTQNLSTVSHWFPRPSRWSKQLIKAGNVGRGVERRYFIKLHSRKWISCLYYRTGGKPPYREVNVMRAEIINSTTYVYLIAGMLIDESNIVSTINTTNWSRVVMECAMLDCANIKLQFIESVEYPWLSRSIAKLIIQQAAPLRALGDLPLVCKIPNGRQIRLPISLPAPITCVEIDRGLNGCRVVLSNMQNIVVFNLNYSDGAFHVHLTNK